MKKGLRRAVSILDSSRDVWLQRLPDEEGIETPRWEVLGWCLRWLQRLPDEEGIETPRETGDFFVHAPLQRLPDEEGIETPSR